MGGEEKHSAGAWINEYLSDEDEFMGRGLSISDCAPKPSDRINIKISFKHLEKEGEMEKLIEELKQNGITEIIMNEYTPYKQEERETVKKIAQLSDIKVRRALSR